MNLSHWRKGMCAMTNAEMFKRVFGFTPQKQSCIMPDGVKCMADNCEECGHGSWWDDEYTGELDTGEAQDG